MKVENFIKNLKEKTEYPIWVSVEYNCPKCGQKKYESWEWGDEAIYYCPFPWEEEHFDVKLECQEIDPWHSEESYSWDITVPYEYEEGECVSIPLREDILSNVDFWLQYTYYSL